MAKSSKQRVKQRQQRAEQRRKEQKQPLIDPKYKNFFSTIIFILVLLVIFIINNTRDEPETGPYPPYYNQAQSAPSQPGN